jgi:hypothetical protein
MEKYDPHLQEVPMSKTNWLAVAIMGILIGCEGMLTMDWVENEEQDLYCYGNADSMIICTDRNNVWTCEDMPNGDVKCVHTPDGQPGWECTMSSGHLVCTTDNPNAGGGAGWDCVSDDVSTTCTSVGSVSGGPNPGLSGFSPPGSGGEWSCTGTEQGVVCIGSFGGGGTGDLPSGTGGQPPSSSPPGGDSSKPKPGDFRTQTPGGWGAPASGNNAGAYRDAHFDSAFPGGLTIGCSGGHTAHFTSAKAIENFLPNGTTPGVLDQDYVDPLFTSAGILAGHTVALTLAVGFDGYDPDFGASGMEIKHLVAASGTCKGMTVQQILQLANAVVGGCSTQLDPSAITTCVDSVNNNFVDGAKANGYLAFP